MYSTIINAGVKNASSPSESKKIKLLNIYCLTWLHLILIYTITDLLYGVTKFIFIHVVSLICMVLVIKMNTLNLFKWSKGVWLFYSILNFSLISFYISPSSYLEYFFLLVPGASLSLFDNNKVNISVLILTILLFFIPYYYLNTYPPYVLQFFKPPIAIGLFICVFLLINYFKKLNSNNEKLLKLERDKILRDKIILEKQQKELKILEKFKTHFFVNLSHEIRTPLTLIKGYASRITLPKKDIDNHESLEVIKTQTEQIHTIVNNILDLAKLETNNLKLNKTDIDVHSFIKKIYTDFDELFIKKNISFSLDMQIPIILMYVDVDFFKKTLNNLIHNALKFTSKEGGVIIKVTYNEVLKIAVIDNGIGIPKEDLEKVFERFYQSKNHITNSQGSGIGLAFTKSIIEAHNFKLTVKSTPNTETKFTIIIPKKAIKTIGKTIDAAVICTKKENENASIQSNSSKPKILIVEDNKDMRDYLKLVLNNYQVIEAENGKEGLKALQKNNFDTIITDYMMPVMDGIEFIKEVKKQAIQPPIIVITARSDDKGKLNILRLGIDAYLTKPFLEDELLLNVKRSIHFYNQIKAYKRTIPKELQLKLDDDEVLFDNELKNAIKNNYKSKTFSVEILSDILMLSRSSLFRKVKLYYGQTPKDIINEFRFQKAKELLDTDPKIKKKDLAEAVGILNATYFYKKLKERFVID